MTSLSSFTKAAGDAAVWSFPDASSVLHDNLDAAWALIDDSDVVSFDFFDTLVTRLSASPDSVQHYVGHRLNRKHSELNGFFARRKGAEQAIWARQPDIGDVDIDMIHAAMADGPAWAGEPAADARQLEWNIDLDFIRPRDTVIELLRYAKQAGKRTIVVSDSYFTRSFFETILQRYGWDHLVDEIYVSSHHKVRKSGGGLWKHVRMAEGLDTKAFVHFGDNLHSDIAAAEANNLRASLIPNTATLAVERGLGHLPDVDWRADILLGPLFARLGNAPFSPTPYVVNEPHEFGYLVYGPIFAAFFAWLVENPALRRMDQVFFSAREGYFLQRLYDRLIAEFVITGMPPSRYLPISRRAVIMASQAVSFDPIRIIDGGGFQGTVAELLRARLGLIVEDPRLFIHPIRLPEDRAYVNQILTILRPTILEVAERERAAMAAFCADIGLAGGGLTGLVDVGYSGTIQWGLQHVLRRPLSGFYMLTSPRAAAVRDQGGTAYGCFQDALYGDVAPDGFMLKTPLLEALMTAPHGQVARFEVNAHGAVEPVYLPGGWSQANFPTLEAMFEGAIAYCRELMTAGGLDVLSAIVPARRAAFCALESVRDGRLKVGEHIAAALYLEDNFSGNGEISCLPDSVPRVLS